MEPFDALRDSLPGWTLAFTALEGVMGFCDTEHRTIWVDVRLPKRQRRSTIVHEVLHAMRGDTSDDPAAERQVDLETARILAPIDALALAMTWSHNVDDICDMLEVDYGVLQTRIRNLTIEEASTIRRQLIRDAGVSPAAAAVAASSAAREAAGRLGACVIGRWWAHASGDTSHCSRYCACRDALTLVPADTVDEPTAISA